MRSRSPAFCRSTPLARALHRPGKVAALNEPHILTARPGAGVARADRALLSFGMERATAQEIAEGPVFASHAKSGEDFATKDAADAARSRSAVTEEEIAQVGQWIDLIASQLGLETPRPQTLF